MGRSGRDSWLGIIAGSLAGYVGERAKCDYSIASKPDFIKTDFNFTALGVGMIAGSDDDYLINPTMAEIMKELSNWLTQWARSECDCVRRNYRRNGCVSIWADQ